MGLRYIGDQERCWGQKRKILKWQQLRVKGQRAHFPFCMQAAEPDFPTTSGRTTPEELPPHVCAFFISLITFRELDGQSSGCFDSHNEPIAKPSLEQTQCVEFKFTAFSNTLSSLLLCCFGQFQAINFLCRSSSLYLGQGRLQGRWRKVSISLLWILDVVLLTISSHQQSLHQ